MATSPSSITRWYVGCVYTDGTYSFPTELSYDNKEDADKVFTRLENARFPGDGIKYNYVKEITTTISYTEGIKS